LQRRAPASLARSYSLLMAFGSIAAVRRALKLRAEVNVRMLDAQVGVAAGRHSMRTSHVIIAAFDVVAGVAPTVSQ